MFSQETLLTVAAHRLLEGARHEAEEHEEGPCGLEHLFLAAVREPGSPAAQALATFDLGYADVRDAVDALTGGDWAPSSADRAVEWAQLEDDLWPSRRKIDDHALLLTVLIRADTSGLHSTVTDNGDAENKAPYHAGGLLAQACKSIGLPLQRYQRTYEDLFRHRPRPSLDPSGTRAHDADTADPWPSHAQLSELQKRLKSKPGVLERLDAIEARLDALAAQPRCHCKQQNTA